MAFFTDFLDFVEYSTSVEYSDGHEKNFWPKKQIKITPKKIVSIGSLVLKILMGGTPPQKKTIIGGRLIFDLSQMHLGMLRK